VHAVILQKETHAVPLYLAFADVWSRACLDKCSFFINKWLAQEIERGLFEPFIYKQKHSTKTGSVQT
jgi:hypothetical protein